METTPPQLINLKTSDMKKYSNMRMLIEYILIMFAAYLAATLAITVLTEFTFLEVARGHGHILALIFIYWWLPVPRMTDMESYNSSII